MINLDSENKGIFTMSGPADIIMTEYTFLTGMLLNRLEQDFGKETAFKVLSILGQVAANNIEVTKVDLKELQNEIMKSLKDVFKDEI